VPLAVALGRVSIVAPKDNGFLSLAECTLTLPDTGTWRNIWVDQTCCYESADPLHLSPAGAGSDVDVNV